MTAGVFPLYNLKCLYQLLRFLESQKQFCGKGGVVWVISVDVGGCNTGRQPQDGCIRQLIKAEGAQAGSKSLKQPNNPEHMKPQHIISLRESFWLNEGTQIRRLIDQLV